MKTDLKAIDSAAPRTREPSAARSVLLFVALVGLMVWLRLFVFHYTFLTLTYGLPLLVCLWHRDLRLLWGMSAAFTVTAFIKSFVVLPDLDPTDHLELMQFLMQISNIVVIAATVHTVIHFQTVIEQRNASLRQVNEELAQKQEEIARQNEELQSQAEELARQNEEMQQQTEELAQQNEELGQQAEELQAQSEDLQAANKELNQRESMLDLMLSSIHGAENETELLRKISGALVALNAPHAVAAAIVEVSSDQLLVRTQAGAEKLKRHEWPLSKSFAGIVIAEGRTGFVDDLRERPDLIVPEPDRETFRSILATPLRVGGALYGAVELYSREPRHWTEQEFRIIEWVADQSGRALHTLRLQERLQRNEAQLRTILENLSEGLVVMSLDGRVLQWNTAGLAMHGFSKAEAANATLAQLEQQFRLADLNGQPLPLENWPMARALRGEKFSGIPARVTHLKNGTERIFSYSGSLARDARGNALLAIVSVSDITEHEEAEARTELLAEAAGLLLASDSPQKVVDQLCARALRVLDCDVFFNFLADEARQALHLNACGGVSADRIAALEWLDYGAAVCGCAARDGCRIVAEDIPHRQDPRTDLVASLGVQAYACTPLKAGDRVLGTLSFGSRRRTRFRPDELALMQAVADLVAIAIERQRAHRELQRMNAELEERVDERTQRLQDAMGELEHFSYTITHDMRAPLRAMQGFASLMSELCGDTLESEKKDCLRHIGTAAARMDRLITDALSYSKTVKQEFALHPVEPAPLLHGMLASYPDLRLPKADIRIEEPLPPVLANEAGLTQCFSNLLGNAVKFVAPGTLPQVRVRAQTNDGHVRLWVEDNGIGIPREAHGKLFNMFQRVSKQYEGTGVGLALVKKVIERMNGRIGFESEPGKGSRFWIELPAGARNSPARFHPPQTLEA